MVKRAGSRSRAKLRTVIRTVGKNVAGTGHPAPGKWRTGQDETANTYVIAIAV
jgi:hypothetical protein